MIKRIAHISIWVLLLVWVIVVMSMVRKKHEKLECSAVHIEISDSLNTRFITQKWIRDLLVDNRFQTLGQPVSVINTRKIEHFIEESPYVENVEVYSNINGELFVEVEQRIPLLRIVPNGRSGYYVDANGHILPVTEEYFPMVSLFTGSFPEEKFLTEDKLMLKEDMQREILAFASFLAEDEFWDEQIVQVYRSETGEYELIPRVGAHQIILGSILDFDTKLRNLKLLYDQGLRQYGWNTYKKINLKYSNQVICTKR